MQQTDGLDFTPLATLAADRRDRIIGLAAALVATPSLPGREGALAEVLMTAMRELAYDEVFTDSVGNVIGRRRGSRTGPTVLFTVHLDHADPGDHTRWQYPPYAARQADGFLHGCGASNHKGALAAMVHAGGLLAGDALQGDFIFAGIVLSQAKANMGLRTLVDKTLPELGIQYDLAILGNPTHMDLHLGHRGRLELTTSTIGRTCHASAPWLGGNAIYDMVPVLTAIQELATTLPSHPFLERSTLAVTGIESAPQGGSMIPDRCTIGLDRRFLPGESVDAVVWQVQSIVNRLTAEHDEFKAEVAVRQTRETAYTGEVLTATRLLHPFVTDAEHALVRTAREALKAIDQAPQFGKWNFATDGGYIAAVKRITTLGYGPGDEKFAQTPFDRVALDDLVRATAGYAAIARAISG